MSKGKKITVGYRYYVGLHMGVCAGPIDALTEIRVGDRQVWTGTQTTSGTLAINKPDLFGGEEREGGIQGNLNVMMGDTAQVANDYLTSVQGATQPAYRGLVGVVWRQGLVSCNNPYIKPWAFKVQRLVKGWKGDTVWYSAKASITLPNGAGTAMNPAHIVYECLTNAEWGMGYGSSLIDNTSFTAAADTFFTEGMGLCMKWTRQQPIEQFVQQIMDHVGAVMGQDRRTGLFVMRLLRGNYVVANLPLYDESSVLSIDEYQRPALPEAVNEISVQYDDIVTGKTGSVSVQNLANITSQGGVVTQGRSYPGLPTSSLAIRVAMRDLRAASTPICKVRMRVNRKGYALLPGDVIRLNWSKLGLTNLVLRVLRVNIGTVNDSKIEVEAAEDIFILPTTTYAAQQPIGWTSPNTAPVVASIRVLGEATYYEAQRELGATAAQALPPERSFAIAYAVRPSGDSMDYGFWTRVGTAAYVEQERGVFCPTGVLTSAIGHVATSATLANLVDADQVATGTFAALGTELVRIDTFNATTGAVTIGRGILGTVAQAHPIGTRLYFRDGFTATDDTERVDYEIVDMRLTTRTTLGELTLAEAPSGQFLLNQIPIRPYAPGQLRINATPYPTQASFPITVTWAHRHRLQQNFEGDTSGNIGPEAGTTYTAELRNLATNALLTPQQALIATTSWAVPTLNFAGDVRLILWSVRDGYTSGQQHDYSFKIPNVTATGKTLTPAASFIRGTATA